MLIKVAEKGSNDLARGDMDETTGNQKSHSERATLPDTTIEQETLQRYLDAALKQYELPTVHVSLLTVLGYATHLEMGIQLLGAIMAIAAGLNLLSYINFQVQRCH